jgi:hypothetical protein
LSTSPVPLSPIYLSVRTFACAPQVCGPHASRIVWPAFTPQCKPARPARPRLGAVCVPSVCARTGRRARAFPACTTACSPSRLSLLSGAARSAPPRRLIDYRLPAGTLSCRDAPPRDPAPAGATVGRCLPAVRACQVWGLGVQHRRRSSNDCPPFSLEIWGWDRESVFS